MNIDQIKRYCKSLPDVKEVYKGEPSNVLVYKIGEKNFSYFKTSEPERWRFSFRVTPERFLEMTDQQGVKPARYMGRFYWLTIINVSSIDDQSMKRLIEWSYCKALGNLSKSKQNQLREKYSDFFQSIKNERV